MRALKEHGPLRIGTLSHFKLDGCPVCVGIRSIVGPGSGVAQAQNIVYRMRRFEEARGWGNQLQNELVVNLKHARVGTANRPLEI